MHSIDLRTARLWLRPLTMDDTQPLAQLWSDPRVAAQMGDPHDVAGLLQNLAGAAAEQLRFDLWPAIERESGQLIGYCGILEKEVDGATESELVVGFHPQFCGKGYASEAASALRDDAFDRLGRERIIALIEPGNEASTALAERVGMRYEKEFVCPGCRRMQVYALDRANRPGGLAERLSPRLRLVALTETQLRWLLTAPANLERQLGLSVSREMLTGIVHRAISIKLEKMRYVPLEQLAWISYWLVVVRSEQFVAGLAGFKGAPDRTGAVEIGYGIDPSFGGRGYTTEAVASLVTWALSMPDCRVVTAETHVDNLASQRVLAKNGFLQVRRDQNSLFWQIDKHGVSR